MLHMFKLLKIVLKYCEPPCSQKCHDVTVLRNRLEGVFHTEFLPKPALSPTVQGTYTLDGDAEAIAADANYAYIVQFGINGQNGLRVLSLFSPSTPLLAYAANATNYVADLLLHNGNVYYAEERGGLQIRQAIVTGARVRDWSLY
jgi:hypothetical protein